MIPDNSKRSLGRLTWGNISLLLLTLAHVPYLLRYYQGLWSRPEYQFFPFAIGTFVWLFLVRRSSLQQPWSVPVRLLFGLDGLCLVAAVVFDSPWLAAIGMIALCLGWCLHHRDLGYPRSTGYLVLLLATTLRLPLRGDEEVIHWLQRVTTAVSSQTFHRLGVLHFRDGNVLRFPDKSFLVAEACSGVQSLFAILFLAALVICLRRRSIVRGIVLLAAGFSFAAGMNIARIMAIAFAWERYQVDLSVGIVHDLVGYGFLGVAAALLMSADSFLGFALQQIPDVSHVESVAEFRNPVIAFWNQVIALDFGSVNSTTDPSDDDADKRNLPGMITLLNPRYWFHFLTAFVWGWFWSRTWRQAIGGLPFCIAGAAGLMLGAWLSAASDASAVGQYLAAYNQAQQIGDVAREETCLRALSSLRPYDPEYRFLLGKLLIAHDHVEEGRTLIGSLTPKQTDGYPAARLWLVRQALQPGPVLPLDYAAIEEQLLIVLRQQPENPDVHQLLSQIYAGRSEWQLAERHLEEAIRFKPELNLQLARLKRTLNRGPDAVRACGKRAAEALLMKLEQDRLNPEIRIALSDAQLEAGEDMAARETLIAGLKQSADDQPLKKALASFDLKQVEKRLSESPLNRDRCLSVTTQAMTLDPTSVAGLIMIEKLQAMGASIPPDSLNPAVAHWKSAVADDPENQASRIILSQCLTAVGRSSESVEVLLPLVASRPELRLVLGTRQIEAGRTEDAIPILESLISESRSQLAASPNDVLAAETLAESLLVLGRSEEARMFLQTLADGQTRHRIPSNPDLASLYGRACILEYDRMTGYQAPDSGDVYHVQTEIPASAAEGMLLELLTEAIMCRSTAVPAIDRLARLSFSSHAAADDAEAAIRQLRLEGDYGAEILNRLGMYALMLQKYETGKNYLEQAHARSRSQSPMIMNNLAIALVRSDPANARKALELANQTLEKIPGQSEALATRGEIYVALREWNLAIADLTEAMKGHMPSAEIHRLLQRAYTEISDPGMAAEHARKAAELESTAAVR